MRDKDPIIALDNKVALVTGAASEIGIGRATALALARAGAQIAVNDLAGSGLIKTVEFLREQGANAGGYHADVADLGSVEQMVNAIEQDMGPIDILVSNAGIARKRPFLEMSESDWRQTLDVNLGGAKNCARAVANMMVSRGRGRIINVSSIMGGWWGWAAHAHYSASKAGIEGLTRALAVELGPYGITANSVAPGFIVTEQSLSTEHSAGPEKMALATPLIPSRRLGRAEDIAGVIAFLASDAANYINGQVLLVDGGLTLGDLRHVYAEPL